MRTRTVKPRSSARHIFDESGAKPTTIRVARFCLAATKRLQAEITNRGVDHLPPRLRQILSSTTCPLCAQEMRAISGSLVCACGMAKPGDPFALGAAGVVGYALVALAAMLADERESGRAP